MEELVNSNLIGQIQAVRFLKAVLPQWRNLNDHVRKMAEFAECIFGILANLIVVHFNIGSSDESGNYI